MLTRIVEKVKPAQALTFDGPAPALSLEPEIRPAPLRSLVVDGAPTELHFVRSHFDVPSLETSDWILELGGDVENPFSISLAELRRRSSLTQTVVLECAGHRRREFQPATQGVQWGAGAISEARWTGTRLADLLAEASPGATACEVVFEGSDQGLHRTTRRDVPFARSIPVEWAAAHEVLLAWEMNGAPIPRKHGGPLRAIVPGAYAVDSVKWLRRIDILAEPFCGPFQLDDYRLFDVRGRVSGQPLHELPVSALIVDPESGARITAGPLLVSGVAWGGQGGIAEVEIRFAGRAWEQARVEPAGTPHALSRWTGVLAGRLGDGTIEVRARDGAGAVQPDEPEWNALGYANNGVHRVDVVVSRAAFSFARRSSRLRSRSTRHPSV